jgi:alcohol dehydrogenase class IV
MIQFEFATAGRIIFGAGSLADVGALAAGLGRRALVVTGGDTVRATPLLDFLGHAGVSFATFSVVGEPTTDTARDGAQKASRERCELVIGIGGGSVLDAGKAIAALLTNGGDPLDYLEVIGGGKPLTHPSAPFIAIPTTAGTGTEVTRNAVLLSPEHRVKVSLRSPYMLPTVALIDPDLTHSLPPHLTASTGLDALTQVLEPYVTHLSTPLTDALCLDGLHRVARSLRRAFANGDDVSAREDMSLASLCGGLALANAKLGAVHGLAGPFGGMFDAPHGAVCAALLPCVMEINVRALRQRQPGSEALTRYEEVAQVLTGDPDANVFDGVVWVQDLCRELQVPKLGLHGLTEKEFPTLIEKAQKASSMKGNPIKLTPVELQEILELAL